jgi:hypothetical protein
VLSAMLLKMIEPPRRIDRAEKLAARDDGIRSPHRMDDAAALVFIDVDNIRIAHSARIVRLAAAGRVECGSIQYYLVNVLATLCFEHGRCEFKQGGVGEVKSVCLHNQRRQWSVVSGPLFVVNCYLSASLVGHRVVTWASCHHCN